MKIGLSFSRCVLDIVEGRVDPEDVLVVIARTDFDPNDDDQWAGIWRGYSKGSMFGHAEWSRYTDDDEDTFRAVAMTLYNDGKLHQPRKFGAHPRRRPEFWLEAVLPSEELDRNPAVKTAWENFQVVAGLTNTKLDKDYQ